MKYINVKIVKNGRMIASKVLNDSFKIPSIGEEMNISWYMDKCVVNNVKTSDNNVLIYVS